MEVIILNIGLAETYELVYMRIGTTEIVLLLVLAIIVFGANRLSGIGKALGTNIREFKKETTGSSEKTEEAVTKAEAKDDETKNA